MQSNLKTAVDNFIASSELAHQFTRGDKTVIVMGADGQYPSLAKLAADAQLQLAAALATNADALHAAVLNGEASINTLLTTGQASIDKLIADGKISIDAAVANGQSALAAILQSAQGMVARKFTFAATKSLHIIHNMGTFHFDEKIINVNGFKVYAPVRLINNNEFVIEFTDYEEGTLTVVFYLSI